ncbi:HTH-type dhaKLM operon transcriptional activator DhaS [Clostridiales bacterium]|nr:HTH-type dhaKLM operon transcriptional activator DhaS [Lachnospiraceae bacterium]GFI61872.1 HTH-type dhaKLM operon transcriptional activator DhaS [Clostridiales bacterium]
MLSRNGTEIMLAESFKELVLRQPIEKITIKEITEKAGVIRPTFYNHFQDKYELLEWIILTDLLEPIRPLIENKMVSEALLLLFMNIEKEREFYKQTVRLEGQNSFESIARECVKEILLEIIEKNSVRKIPKFRWLTPERIAEYYAQSMCSVVIVWIKSGMTISAKELVEIYEYMMEHSIAEILFE